MKRLRPIHNVSAPSCAYQNCTGQRFFYSLNDVVEILVLAHQDINTGVGLDAFNGRRVGAALVYGDLLWHVMQVDRPLQKPPRCGKITFGSEQKTPYRHPDRRRGKGISTGLKP